jgi:hypothetical protein
LEVVMTEYYIGVDLGQAQDYTALAVVERVGVPTGEYDGRGGPQTVAHYHVRHLERFPLGTPYPAIVDGVRELMTSAPLVGKTDLVVDATGVGAPVVDLLRQACSQVFSITITGGDEVSVNGLNYRVPKRDLIGTVQVLLQTKRLKIAPALPEADTLANELRNFRVKMTPLGHDTYGVWREGSHDDLVLAVALACWRGERHIPVLVL